MFKSNEQYELFKVVINDKFESKIHEFNGLILSTINLLSKDEKEEYLDKLETYLGEKLKTREDTITYNSLIIEMLDKTMNEKITFKIYKNIFEILEKINAVVIIPSSNSFVFHESSNTLLRTIKFGLNKNLSQIFINSYQELDFNNVDVKSIMEKFSKTQQIDDEIELNPEVVDFTGININDIKEFDIPEDEVDLKIFREYTTLVKCGIPIEEKVKMHLSYVDIDQIRGVLIDKFFFPFNYELFRNKINDISLPKYDFQYIKRNLDHTLHKNRTLSNKKRKSIREKFMNYFHKDRVEFSHLLSRLENNFYLKYDQSLEDHCLFEKSYLLKKNLKKDSDIENIKHYNFIIPHSEKEKVPKKKNGKDTFFGLYSDDQSRNHKSQQLGGLKSWISYDGKTCNYNQESGTKDMIQEILHLDPNSSFYYQQHFFEDLLEDLFTELKDNGEIIDVLYSVELNGKEYDFIVLTNSNKLVVFEAKTKLSGFYIEKELSNVDKLHTISDYYKSDTTRALFDDSVIIGFNSDNSCEEKFSHFINTNDIVIDGLVDSPKSYSFKVPISSHENKKLYCISDISYDNLKLKIMKTLETKIEAKIETKTETKNHCLKSFFKFLSRFR